MGSEALLLFSLLGGYLFIHISHYFRYRAQALNGTRLLFECAAAGLPFLLIVRLGASLLPFRPSVRHLWSEHVLALPYGATISAAFLLAVLLGMFANLAVGVRYADERDEPEDGSFRRLRKWLAASRRMSLDWAVERYGNRQQKLQYFAATHAEDGYLLGVTLTNRRIYAGYVLSTPELSPNDGYVNLLPVMSGYRDAEYLRATYDYLYPMFAGQHPDRPDLDIPLTLPIAAIQSMHLLDTTDLEETRNRLAAAAATPPGTNGVHGSGA